MGPEGYFALVSYLPHQLASCLTQIRKHFGMSARSEPHVTVLPRRPLARDLEKASRHALNVLSGFPAFQVELSSVQLFAETNVLYLGISRGRSNLETLHAALNTGQLAHKEEFEFLPHLTLGGPVQDGEALQVHAQVAAEWEGADCPRSFLAGEIVCLWQAPDSDPGCWQPIWCHKLNAATEALKPAASAAVVSRR